MSVPLRANAIARHSLVLLLFALPWFVIPVSWATAAEDKALLAALFLAIALMSYCIGRFVAGAGVIPRHPILAAALLLPFCYALSAYLSGASVDSWVSGYGDQGTVATMVLLSLALALAATLFAGRGNLALRPLLALILGGGIVVLFQLVRLLFPALTLGGMLSGSASSIVGGWHDLGIFTGFLLLSSVSLASDVGVARWARVCLSLVALGAVALLIIVALSEVWFALAASFLLLVAYSLVNARRTPRAPLLRGAAIAFVFGALSLGAAFSTAFYSTHLPPVLRIEQPEVRLSWQATLGIADRIFSGGQAFYGTGPNTFADQWAKWKPLAVNQSDYWNTDFQTGVGLIPTALLTAGALGAIAWLALLLALLYEALSAPRAAPERGSFLATLVGGSLFLFYFHIVYAPSLAISLTLFFLLGLIVVQETSEVDRTLHVSLGWRRVSQIGATAALLLLTLAGLASSYATARATLSDMFVAKAVADYNAGNGIPHSLALVQFALSVYPSNAVAHRAAVSFGLIQLQALMQQGAAANATELQTMLKTTIDEGLAAVSIDSKDYQNWLSLAGLYQELAQSGVSGAGENALSAYAKAAAANPTNPLPRLNAGYVSLSLGDATSAVSYVTAALGLKPDLASGYYLRSQAESELGEYANAVSDAKQAILLAKDDPSGWYNLGAILYQEGDYSDAALALSQSITLQNDYANAYFLLSLALARSGQHDEAIQAMQKVLALNPGNQTALGALASLEAATSTTAATSSENAAASRSTQP